MSIADSLYIFNETDLELTVHTSSYHQRPTTIKMALSHNFFLVCLQIYPKSYEMGLSARSVDQK